ncbi:MAG TPA: luciferase family protein [Thermoplasmata archaeon]|nr:luciferase family protein [Thermoplasmata archaeon]
MADRPTSEESPPGDLLVRTSRPGANRPRGLSPETPERPPKGKARGRAYPTRAVSHPVSLREELEGRLAGMPGLTRLPGRRGTGSRWVAGNQEIAHFHGEERLDIRLTKERIRSHVLEQRFDERVRTRGPSAEWINLRLTRSADLDLALSLVAEAQAIGSERSDRDAPEKIVRRGKGEG